MIINQVDFSSFDIEYCVGCGHEFPVCEFKQVNCAAKIYYKQDIKNHNCQVRNLTGCDKEPAACGNYKYCSEVN